MKYIDAILVVEGKSDVAYLSNYFSCEYIITNGSDIPESTISYLKEMSNKKKIIVLTDPDSPGKRIRSVLDENIPNLSHCYIEKKYAIKNGKVGVAECDIEEIERALSNEFVPCVYYEETISMSDLYALGLIGAADSKKKREIISKNYRLGFNNAKSLYKKLNSLKISSCELKKALNE